MAVLNNANNNAPYVLRGALAAMPSTNQTRNLNAESGWTGRAYTQPRAAGPFAILDTIFKATEAFVAIDSDIDFPKANILWSVTNRSASGNVSNGEIGTSSYTRINNIPTILILGEASSDADEYDEHVVSHEFGHYFEDKFSRSDSIGGAHSTSSLLDPRVAFGEGWGNALSGIISGQIYRDSSNNGASSFGIDLERNGYSNAGWFRSASVQSILYDIMDSASDTNDTLSEGLGPVYAAFTSDAYKAVDEFTTIYTFINGLRAATTVNDAAITQLVTAQDITGTGPAATGETNSGGIAGRVPVYRPLTVGAAAQAFCSVDDAGVYNRLGNRTFFKLDLASAATVRFTMDRTSAPAQTDPDFVIYRQGARVANAFSDTADQEVRTVSLSAGEYIIDAYDDVNARQNQSGHDSCFTFIAEPG